MPINEITSAIVRTQRAQEERSESLVGRAWTFYFAHRPLIVLGMISYLALIHLAAVGLFWNSAWPGIIAWKLGIGTRWVEFDQNYKIRRRTLARLSDSIDPGAVLFIGDSLLNSMDIGALSDRAVQLSVSGDTTVRLHARVQGYRAINDARLVFLHVGSNDLKYRTPEKMRQPLARILGRVPADVPVIMSAILPVDERVFRRYDNATIDSANAVLQQVCEARANCTFLRTGAGLRDATGNLDPRHHVGDGLHLNGTGNRLWRAELMPILAPWQSL